MRIGFLLLHPFSHSMASSVRVLELALSLKKLGVTPIIFSPYEETCDKNGILVVKIPSLFTNQKMQNNFYELSRSFYYNKNLQNIIYLISKNILMNKYFASRALIDLFLDYNLDAIQAEQDNAALLLTSIKDQMGIPVTLDLHGIWPEELIAANAITRDSKPWMNLQNLMKSIINEMDILFCLSDYMKKYVIDHYERKNNVVVVPPGGKKYVESYEARTLPYKIVYSGMVSYRKHVDLFVNSMPYILNKYNNVNFYITRKGDLLNNIQNLSNNLKVNPTYYWYDDYTSVINLLRSSHIGVHPSTVDISAKLSMPSKIFDYLSAGLPIVANEVGGWTDILKTYKVGLLTENNSADFSRGILEFLDSPDKMAEYGERGIDLIKKIYNWDISAKIMFNEYCKILH